MSWFIDADINNGYPFNSDFPQEFRTDFYSGSDVQLPYGAWRIKAGVNKGYPWKYWWFKEDVSAGGNMEIGGRQTNYPDGFSTLAQSFINFDGNGQDFDDNPFLGSLIAQNSNLYATNAAGIKWITDWYASQVNSVSDSVREKVAQLLGGNLMDSIIICKIYPFTIPADTVPAGQISICSGLFMISPDTVISGQTCPLCTVTNTSVLLDFGYINPGIANGWEIETVDWSIYLPYCGEFPIDLRSNESLQLYCLVDLISGNCEYYLLLKKNNDHSGDIIFSTSGKMGTDFPVNLNSARLASNLQGWKNVAIGKGLELAGGALGGGMLGAAGRIAGPALKGSGSAMEKVTSHHTFVSPSLGGGVCFGAPKKARLIGRRPNIQKNATGVPELLGLKYGYMVNKVSDLGIGKYSEFDNYKCDIIVATTEEKAEIESLMNSGVFV